jgi:hypothetical protein
VSLAGASRHLENSSDQLRLRHWLLAFTLLFLTQRIAPLVVLFLF